MTSDIYVKVPARCRLKVALRHTKSYCHKRHLINGCWTRPILGQYLTKVFVTLRKIEKNGNINFPSLALNLTLTVTLSPNDWTTSNFG